MSPQVAGIAPFRLRYQPGSVSSPTCVQTAGRDGYTGGTALFLSEAFAAETEDKSGQVVGDGTLESLISLGACLVR